MTPQEANKIIAEYMGNAYLVKYLELKDNLDASDKSVLNIEMMKIIQHTLGQAPVLFSDSLDAIVSVWEKLSMYKISPRLAMAIKGKYFCEICYSFNDGDDWDASVEGVGDTVQEAAAIASAKVIQELM